MCLVGQYLQVSHKEFLSAFVDTNIVKLFYSLYETLPTGLMAKALGCLVQLASVRRTIFNNNERQQYLSSLLLGAKGILDNPQVGKKGTVWDFHRLRNHKS